MNRDSLPIIDCTCGAAGKVHPDGCRMRAQEFLADPAAEYLYSRRAFLKGALAGGLTLALLPLLREEAEGDIFMPGVNDQKKMGDQAAQQVLRKYREVRDS